MRLRTIVGALSFSALAVAPSLAQASSHREAPFITKNPKVDGTDMYAFESYESGHTGMITLIADYQPFQDAYGGPNYFSMDPDALYEINVDNDGDGVEDITFQFQFQQTLANNGDGISLSIGGQKVAVPFYNVGLIPNGADNGSSGNLNFLETYTVNVVYGPKRDPSSTVEAWKTSGGSKTFQKPADNVGAKSFNVSDASPPVNAYADYAKNFIYNNVAVPHCTTSGKAQVFVGQRAEPFAVNLGPIFDLIDAPAGIVTGGLNSSNYAAVPNPLLAKNITSLAIEIPRECLTQANIPTDGGSTPQPVIGVWTTASVRQARVVNPAASFTKPSVEGGAWTQVSRLGNPLVNEVVIGIPDKDKWNSSVPTGDVENFGTYVEYPTLPAIIDAVFGVSLAPNGAALPRLDLVGAFLEGIPLVNSFPNQGTQANPKYPNAEYLHLNTDIEGSLATLGFVGLTPGAAGAQNRLGAAQCVTNGAVDPTKLSPYAPATSCDPFGYPNGRRPIDDVVDIALDVVEGYLLPSGTTNPASGTFFTDGVDQAANTFLPGFPYILTPNGGANGNGT